MIQAKGDRIFTLAWEFPPRMSGESVVCLRALKHSTLSYDVCCGESGTAEEMKLPPNIRVYPRSGKYIRWPFGALRLFNRLNKTENYKVIYSRIMPPIGHAAGLLIKLFHPKLKWVVYFSDPVWNSPFIRFPIPWGKDETHRPNYWLMKLYGIPARIAMKKCDLLVFNNERLARYVTGKWYEKYRDKICIAPYGHEGIKTRPPREPDGKFILAHVGQVYGNRTLKALVEAVELLQKDQPELFSRLTVRQVGFICQTEAERIRRSPAAVAFQVVDQVSYEESIIEMYRADCLVTIDPVFDDPKNNIYVPAKILDYMSVGKPIIAIADEDSATGDIMGNVGKWIVSHSAEKICDLFENVILTGETSTVVNRHEKYDCRHNSCELDDAVRKLL